MVFPMIIIRIGMVITYLYKMDERMIKRRIAVLAEAIPLRGPKILWECQQKHLRRSYFKISSAQEANCGKIRKVKAVVYHEYCN